MQVVSFLPFFHVQLKLAKPWLFPLPVIITPWGNQRWLPVTGLSGTHAYTESSTTKAALAYKTLCQQRVNTLVLDTWN